MKKPFAFMLLWMVAIQTFNAIEFPALIFDKNEIASNKIYKKEEVLTIMEKAWCPSGHKMMSKVSDNGTEIKCVDKEPNFNNGVYFENKNGQTQIMESSTFWALYSIPEFTDIDPVCFIQKYTDHQDKITTRYFGYSTNYLYKVHGSIKIKSIFNTNENYFLREEKHYNGFTFHKLYCSETNQQTKEAAKKSEEEFRAKKEKEIATEVNDIDNEKKEENTDNKKDKEINDNEKEKKEEDKSSTYIIIIFILIIIILLLIIAYFTVRYCFQDIPVSDDFYYDEEEDAHLPYEPETNEFQQNHKENPNSTHDLFTEEATENHASIASSTLCF